MSDGQRIMSCKWAQLGSNQRPIRYERTALTAELWARERVHYIILCPNVKGGYDGDAGQCYNLEERKRWLRGTEGFDTHG